ncbi:MAG: biotin/lipoyl-binding protein [Symbiobacteriaceae bacterium]|nr:biotin/lipoyl-binding protein [Symbiobacteriaceae bacterium]
MKYIITVNGVAYEVEVEAVEGTPAVAPTAPRAVTPVAAPVATPVAAAPVTPPPAAAPVVAAAPVGAGEKMTCPMPGIITDILLNTGAVVKKGQVILMLEAMKMQNEIVAPCDGTLTSINVSKGEAVKTGQLLFVVG